MMKRSPPPNLLAIAQCRKKGTRMRASGLAASEPRKSKLLVKLLQRSATQRPDMQPSPCKAPRSPPIADVRQQPSSLPEVDATAGADGRAQEDLRLQPLSMADAEVALQRLGGGKGL